MGKVKGSKSPRYEDHIDKEIWDSDEGELATEPIDSDREEHTVLYNQLSQLLRIKNKVRVISDLAFNEIDKDGSNSLDEIEFA